MALDSLMCATLYISSGDFPVIGRKDFPMYLGYTVESPNKGHFGTIILSFVRKVSLIGKSKMY